MAGPTEVASVAVVIDYLLDTGYAQAFTPLIGVAGEMAMLQQLSEFTADLGKAREPLG